MNPVETHSEHQAEPGHDDCQNGDDPHLRAAPGSATAALPNCQIGDGKTGARDEKQVRQWKAGKLAKLSRDAALLQIARIAWAGQPIAGEGPGRECTSIHKTLHIEITTSLLDEAISLIESTTLPRYRDLNEELLLTLSGKVLHDKNHYLAFTLNFSSKLINQARKNKRGFKKHIADSFRRNLQKEFSRSIQFILVLEFSSVTGIHSHGVLGIEATEENKRLAYQALQRVNIEEVDRAICLQEPFNGIYWTANYLTKSLNRTRRYLEQLSKEEEHEEKDHSPVFFDNQTRKELEEFWNHERKTNKKRPEPSRPKKFNLEELTNHCRETREQFRRIVQHEELEVIKQRIKKNPSLLYRFPSIIH